MTVIVTALPLEARASEAKQKDRLHWFHTTINLDATLIQVTSITPLPCLNMTLQCLIFYTNLSKPYPVRFDEWFDRLQLKP